MGIKNNVSFLKISKSLQYDNVNPASSFLMKKWGLSTDEAVREKGIVKHHEHDFILRTECSKNELSICSLVELT